MKRKKRRFRPFRAAALLMGLGTLLMMMRFPGKAVSLERQQQQLEEAAGAYYDAQMTNNRLRVELAEINSSEFVERTARRDYGYCWYGETVYKVMNLEELEQGYSAHDQE